MNIQFWAVILHEMVNYRYFYMLKNNKVQMGIQSGLSLTLSTVCSRRSITAEHTVVFVKHVAERVHFKNTLNIFVVETSIILQDRGDFVCFFSFPSGC